MCAAWQKMPLKQCIFYILKVTKRLFTLFTSISFIRLSIPPPILAAERVFKDHFVLLKEGPKSHRSKPKTFPLTVLDLMTLESHDGLKWYL